MSAMAEISLSEIKNELRKLGAKVSGRKKDLIERLEFYRKNADKENHHQTGAEYNMKLPSYMSYKDINKGMADDLPNVSMEKINSYLYFFHKVFEDKCKDMYDERFIRYIRFFKDEPVSFVTASVWAEMRKNVSYKVDIAIESTGVVCEAQCECGVGQGPQSHCKHVVCVLYGVLQCKKKTGKIITAQTCTQTLQTFHRTKPYDCSPLQCTSLKELRGMEKIDYDPRPVHLRGLKGKMDRVKNLILNQQSVRPMSPMPLMQCFPPANPFALTYDHDYCEGYDTDVFLKNLKITSIHQSDIEKIESLTRSQTRSKVWKSEHEIRMTASNFGRICKLKTADKDKLSRSLIVPKDFFSNATSHGVNYEPVAIEQFEAFAKVKTRKCGLFIDPLMPYLAASPDAVVDETTLVEVKCPYSARNSVVNENTVDYLVRNGDELSLLQTHSYYYQVQGQLMCTGANKCYFVVFTPKDMKVLLIRRDEMFIDGMRQKLADFFHSHFKQAVIDRHFYRDYKKYCFCVACTGAL